MIYMAHALTSMIIDFNNFVSDTNKSIKKSFNFTINEQPNTAYLLGALSVGLIGAMLYRSNVNGIENTDTNATKIIPFSSENTNEYNAYDTPPVETPLLNEPTENTLFDQPSVQDSPQEESPQVDLMNMDNNTEEQSPFDTDDPFKNEPTESDQQTNPFADNIDERPKERKPNDIPIDDDLL
jgi:hypothetical protein